MSDPSDGDPGTHRFNPQTASPALKAAMADLADRSGRPESELVHISMAEAYELAVTVYDELPEFWRTWQSWNASSDQPPAEMGDL